MPLLNDIAVKTPVMRLVVVNKKKPEERLFRHIFSLISGQHVVSGILSI